MRLPGLTCSSGAQPMWSFAVVFTGALLLGGEVAADQDSQFAQWSRVLASPQVKGTVVGRSLLYPTDRNVAAAVDATVEMM